MRKFPSEQQKHVMDCGATCLRIIARYYGRNIPLARLRESSGTNRAGTSLLGLSRAAEEAGFRTMAAMVTFKKLQQEAPLPLILHWQQQHFVVVYKVTKRKVYISDPAGGLMVYEAEEFAKHWAGNNFTAATAKGVALLLEPSPDFEAIRTGAAQEEKINIRPFLQHYMKPHTRVMLQVMLSLGVGAILQLMVPFLTQNIVDTGVYKKDINFIWLVLLAQLMLVSGQMALEVVRSWLLLFVSSRINISLISDFFSKLMRLPIRYFDTKLSGDLLQRINDHHRIEKFITRSSLNAIFAVFTLFTYSIVLAYYNSLLLVIFLTGSILYVLWILYFLKKREQLDHRNYRHSSENNSKVYELINGMQEIKLHNAEQQKRWSWEHIQIRLYKVSVQSLTLEQTQQTGARIINEIKNILTSFLAAKLVIDGNITLGTMLAVSYIIGQLNNPVLQLVNIVKEWQDARISLDRLMETHLEKEEVPLLNGRPQAAIPVPERHTMVLDNVSFAYDEYTEPVLKNISLKIPSGKVTAIVGTSGSGKTTLLKLLMRFYEPQTGKIRIGNADLSQTNLREWRELCGVVMQEGFIFNDTIAGNIAVGEETPDWDRLKNACDTANISSFIERLPLGFQTVIGQEGTGISTGQKQRILIARAVYKNPQIIFFDEATSALDANNEQIIMQQLHEFYRNKTVIIIAHRLSTVRDADKIVVLENGSIMEEGTHEELSSCRSYYYQLVKNQLELGV